MFYPPGPRGPMGPGVHRALGTRCFARSGLVVHPRSIHRAAPHAGMMNPYMMAGPGRGMPGRGPRGMMMPPQASIAWPLHAVHISKCALSTQHHLRDPRRVPLVPTADVGPWRHACGPWWPRRSWPWRVRGPWPWPHQRARRSRAWRGRSDAACWRSRRPWRHCWVRRGWPAHCCHACGCTARAAEAAAGRASVPAGGKRAGERCFAVVPRLSGFRRAYRVALPTLPVPRGRSVAAARPGGQDHGHAAGDGQLRLATSTGCLAGVAFHRCCSRTSLLFVYPLLCLLLQSCSCCWKIQLPWMPRWTRRCR